MNFMNTRRLSLLGLILILLLAACGGETTPEEAAGSENAMAETAVVAPTIPADATLPPPIIAEIDETTQQEGAPTAEDTTTETAPPAAEAMPEPKGPWLAEDFGYGIQIHGNASVGDPRETMQTVHEQLGMDWVKVQIQWWLVHPDPDVDQWFFYDSVVNEAHEKGLRLMVSVVGAPAWTRADGTENGPPDDYNQYAQFLTEMLQRYDGKIDAVEVWNEQNLDREWATANGVNPEDYVRFLQVAHDAIKAQNPDIIVISGALSPAGGGDWISWIDDFQWLDRGLAAGMLRLCRLCWCPSQWVQYWT